MKKLVLLICVGLVLLAETAFAQNLNKAITIDPLDFVVSKKINLKYEQMLDRKNSFTVEFAFDDNQSTAPGFLIGGAYRWYLRHLIPVQTRGVEGFSVAPYARIGLYRRELNAETTDNEIGLEIGGEIAYKAILWDCFVIEPMIRLGFRPSGGSLHATNKGFNPWPGVSIGYAWK